MYHLLYTLLFFSNDHVSYDSHDCQSAYKKVQYIYDCTIYRVRFRFLAICVQYTNE